MAPFNYTFPNDGYVAPTFVNSHEIVTIHTAAPRFGHTNDFSVLVRSDETATPEAKRDYVTGLFVASVLVLALLVVWAIVLLVLKCTGRDVVGCASGAAFRYPPRPTTTTAEGDGGVGSGSRVDKLASGGGYDDDDDGDSSSTESHGGGDGCLKKKVDDDADGVGRSSASIGTHSTSTEQSPPPTPRKGLSTVGGETAAATTTEAIDTSVVINVDGNSGKPSCGVERAKGQSMEQPLEDEAEEMAAWRADLARIERRARRTRIAFLFSGVIVLIFSSLFIAYGVGFLRESVVSVQGSLLQAEDVIRYSANVTRDFVAGANEAEEARDNFNETFLRTSENACVAAVADGFGIERLDAAVADVVASLVDLRGMFIQEATNLYRDLNTTAVLIGEVRGYTTYSKWAFVVSAIITVAFDVIVIILMVGVVFAWCGWDLWVLRCTRTWVVLPIMVIMVVLIWIFACVFLLGAVTASDFCYNSPDQNVVYVLDQFKDVFSSLTYSLILYYITGCTAEDSPAQFLESGYFKSILHAIDVGHNLILNLTLAPGAVFESCGANETAMDAAAQSLDHALHLLAELFLRVVSIFQCSSFNPIYVGFAHSAVCYNGVTGLNWIFWTNFVVCVFSMIMVTLRVSWTEIQVEGGGGEGSGSTGEQGRGCGKGCTSCGCIRGDRAGTKQEGSSLDEKGFAAHLVY